MIRRLGGVRYKLARRIVIAVIGGTVLQGLATLAIEFAWAQRHAGGP